MADTQVPSVISLKKSLHVRVMSAMGIVLSIAVLLCLALVINFIYHTEKDSWQSRQQEVSRSASRTVGSFMGQVREYLNLISLLDRRYLEADPQNLFKLLHQNPAFLEIICLDEYGNVFASAYRETPLLANLFTIPQSTWFIEAVAGRDYVGEVQVSATDEPYMILAVPALGGGVVAARLRMSVLWDVVSEIKFGQTGRAYVINHMGYVIAHPNREVVLNNTIIADRPEVAAALQAADNEWSGAYRNFENQDVVGVTMPISNYGWVMFTEISQPESLATTSYALLALGGGTLLAGFLLNLVVGRLLIRIVLEPVKRLREGAEMVGRGNLDYRLDGDRPDELGQVAAAFNFMAAGLQERESALAQARDRALAASNFKSRLLANVSHDLRTPLNGIIGYTDMLNEGAFGSLSEQQLSIVGRVLGHAQRLLNLINNLLDQAQIEAGRLELHYEPFNPAKLLGEVESITSFLAQRKGLELVTEIDPELPNTLIGDRVRLQQVLMNLVVNAIKFTEKGLVCVRVYSRGQRWAIEVSDTGIGIPAEAQEYIFNPFRQVHASLNHEIEGLGLGLSIVQELTRLMGGEIRLVSRVGLGSTFTVLLPFEPPKEGV